MLCVILTYCFMLNWLYFYRSQARVKYQIWATQQRQPDGIQELTSHKDWTRLLSHCVYSKRSQ